VPTTSEGLGPEGHILRTLRIIGAHSNVVELSPARHDAKTDAWEIEVVLRLGLPNAWVADGQSPNGVRTLEKVTLRFPAGFPLRAPIVFLRQDFDRSLAHVLPGGPASHPRPCLFDGDLTELLQQQGIAAILNQLVQWLERAALGQLIDPAQGWEPVRRDNLSDFIVADADALRALVTRKGGYAAFTFEYAALKDDLDVGDMLHGAVGAERVWFNPKTAGKLFSHFPPEAGDRWRFGRSIAIVTWPGRDPSGKLIATDGYQPETVADIASLKARADDYGCTPALNSALRWLETSVSEWRIDGTAPLAVILAARRPCHLIGTKSEIELCAYIVDIGAPKLLPEGDQTPVRPAAHRQAITPSLLRRLSDDRDDNAEQIGWVQLGCGSLGSKVALHLARAGRAPSIVIDRSYFSPHNAARHALMPRSSQMQISWIGDKAAALAEAIKGLGQHAEPVIGDIVAITRDKERARKALPKRAWAIVNATASLTAREALGSIPEGIEIPRVVETVLFAAGRLGVVTVEGPRRNPNGLDLMAETYSLLREQEALCALMFAEGAGLTRQSIGEGCGSATMPLSDARVSLLAAPMAEIVAGLQRGALPDEGGSIRVATVGEDGISVGWSHHEAAPVIIILVQGPGGWRVRLSARAASKINDEVARWPKVETGGILMGRMSEAARAFYITDVLPAPEDSERSAGEFCLGVRDARRMISNYAESCGYSLFCLGTWHSHLAPSGPSATDRATAATVALARLAPSVLLIHTPKGYAALLADSGAGIVTGGTLPNRSVIG
jgi:hypothetical protein